MEFLDSWCVCGKQVLDFNSLYCSNECRNADNGSISSLPYHHQSQTPPTPPINLHFSITITPNVFKASESNAKISTPSSYTDSSSVSLSSSLASLYTIDQNYDYVYNNRCCKKNHDIDQFHDDIDNDHYTSYFSTSNPIDIPSPRTQAASDPALEPNNATFGKEKSIF